MLPLLLLLTAPARAADAAAWRTQVGGELNADSHGVFDLGWRRGDWQVQLVTDTLDARWQPEGERGRAWVAARVELGAAGLMISPWAHGAPAPEASLAASYAGVEAGKVWYLPRGFYAGVDGHARWWWFGALDRTDRELIPAAQPRFEGAGFVGWWSKHAQGWVRAGTQVAPGADEALLQVVPVAYPEHATLVDTPARSPQPFASLTLMVRPDGWTLAPRVEVRAGTGLHQDAVSRTRLGGLNPYVVPLAGAAWAEFWVQDYAALRAGPSLAVGKVRVDAVVDAAVWGEPLDLHAAAVLEDFPTRTTRALGLGLLSRVQPNRLYVDLDGGLAPWLPRRDGLAWSTWVAVGVEWGPGGLARPPE